MVLGGWTFVEAAPTPGATPGAAPWEDGVDEGGLTADMHASFWRDVVRSEHGLFARLAEGGAYLPRADASREQLTAVGRMLLKSVLDGRPLARFWFLETVASRMP